MKANISQLALASLLSATACASEPIKTDVLIYGATSGGVIAAVQTTNLGKSVAILEPGQHPGGMTASGLSWTDVGTSDRVAAIGGLARQFYERVGAHYGQAPGTAFDPLTTQPAGQVAYDYAKPSSLSFEPHVAEMVFRQMLAETSATLYLGHELKGVTRRQNRLLTLQTQTGQTFAATVFIDATYEGDLMAAAGVTYTVGREANSQYGETANGIQPPARNPRAGKFEVEVDPYRTPGNPASGPLPYLLQDEELGEIGSADRRVQSYNYRVCLTDRPENRLPLLPPDDFDPANYELLARWTEARIAAGKHLTLRDFLKYDPLQNNKYDFNNRWAISTDFIGGAHEYPEADSATRKQIAKAHENYLRGFFHFLATSPRVPEQVRSEMARFGLCRDEFADNGGWPHQLYVREARRMVSDFVMTEHHCTGQRSAPQSIGLGAYGIDIHAVRRIVVEGQPVGEGTRGPKVPRPYPIGYGALVPPKDECDNLLVPFALSASHVAFGSIRMEPVFMILGQSAATAACLAIDDQAAVQEVDYGKLRNQLLRDGQVLEWPVTKN